MDELYTTTLEFIDQITEFLTKIGYLLKDGRIEQKDLPSMEEFVEASKPGKGLNNMVLVRLPRRHALRTIEAQ